MIWPALVKRWYVVNVGRISWERPWRWPSSSDLCLRPNSDINPLIRLAFAFCYVPKQRCREHWHKVWFVNSPFNHGIFSARKQVFCIIDQYMTFWEWFLASHCNSNGYIAQKKNDHKFTYDSGGEFLARFFKLFFFQPYFCGQNEKCSVIKHDWALENAKLNIEKWYPVIGTLEDLETTFFVLENKLPQFFKGISKIYFEELNGNENSEFYKSGSGIVFFDFFRTT